VKPPTLDCSGYLCRHYSDARWSAIWTVCTSRNESIRLCGVRKASDARGYSEREEALERGEGQEHTDGERRGPGNPVPEGAIDHGPGYVGRIVENGDVRANPFTLRDKFALLELDDGSLHFKFDNGQVHDAAVHAVRAGIAVRMKVRPLETDNFAASTSAVEKEMDVSLAGKVPNSKQSYCGEKLRHEGIAENLLAISKHPLDLGLGKGHWIGLGEALDYLRAKRSKSAIWRSISSRAESEAERMPWMRSLNSSGLEERDKASSIVMSCLL